MTVTSTETPRKQYTGNDSTVAFPITFPYANDADIIVENVTNGVSVTWTLGGTGDDGYTIASDTVTANTAPASGSYLVLSRSTEQTQETDLRQNRRFNADTEEDMFDKQTYISQELQEQSDRSLKLTAANADGIDTELPTPSANSPIGWDAAATGLKNFSSTIVYAANWDTIQNYTDLADAVSTIGATPTTLLIDTTDTIDANLVVPSTLDLFFVRGGVLSDDANNADLTINGQVIAASGQQIFDWGNGTGDLKGSANCNMVHVGWFGPDGTADQTESQQAVDFIPATGGEVLISTSLSVTSFVDLTDLTGVTVRRSGNSTITMGSAVSAVDAIIKIAGTSSRIKILDLEFLGPGGVTTNSTIGVFVTGTATDVEVKGCTVHDLGIPAGSPVSYGISFGNTTSNCRAISNTVYNCYQGIVHGGSGNKSIGNTCYSNTLQGIDLEASTAVVYSVVSNNICYSNGDNGISAAAGEVGRYIIEGNICYGNTDHGISVDVPDCVINNNNCYGNTEHGILLGTAADYSTVTGNSCNNNTLRGIFIQGDYCAVTGNTCNNNASIGLHIQGTSHTVSGNNIFTNGNYGLYAQCSYATINANNIRDNAGYGIIGEDAKDYNTISGNNVYSNGGGINTNGGDYCVINSNSSIDSDDDKGIIVGGGSIETHIFSNILTANTTPISLATETDTYIGDNGNYSIVEVLTVGAAITIVDGQSESNIDSSAGAAVDCTLADGTRLGQLKTVKMTGWAAGGNSTLTVANHETSAPEVFTYGDVGDELILEWNGSVWITVANDGVAV